MLPLSTRKYSPISRNEASGRHRPCQGSERNSKGSSDRRRLNWGGGPATTTANPTPDTPKPPKLTLAIAARDGNLPGVERLLAQNQQQPAEIQDALTVAANVGHDEIILLLLQQDGIDINKESSKGTLPLHRAIQGGHGKAVRLLIEHGADPFRGSPSAIELAERLWKQRPLSLLYEIVDERYPGKRRKKTKTTKSQRLGSNTNASEMGAVAKKSPMSNASSSYVPNQREILAKGTASNAAWPDRVLFRKGEKIVLQPSDPSYWN